MNFHYNYSVLQKHLSQQAYDFILPYLKEYNVGIRVCKPRKTKLADYRPKFQDLGHRVSINNDLNPYYFAITMIHEVAHLLTWEKHQNRVLPHGNEWKQEYKKLMNAFLQVIDWPENLLKTLENHLKRVNASTCVDPQLFKTLNDLGNSKTNLKYLDSLPFQAIFDFNGRVFEKGKKLRTRYKCRELRSNKNYLISGIAQVDIVDK
ncbi:MAG: SprT-like domain-containing protein [Flavobacteriales bacterium]|nr:SprT-like domain-containing protein [Flavobacteriales bacterium]